ncbi:MAG TPA: hypothetical protein VFE65_28515, partial [Pseudonocardia sp.]|nr:hypothetical protein [Pseudonocardia sp.]
AAGRPAAESHGRSLAFGRMTEKIETLIDESAGTSVCPREEESGHDNLRVLAVLGSTLVVAAAIFAWTRRRHGAG